MKEEKEEKEETRTGNDDRDSNDVKMDFVPPDASSRNEEKKHHHPNGSNPRGQDEDLKAANASLSRVATTTTTTATHSKLDAMEPVRESATSSALTTKENSTPPASADSVEELPIDPDGAINDDDDDKNHQEDNDDIPLQAELVPSTAVAATAIPLDRLYQVDIDNDQQDVEANVDKKSALVDANDKSCSRQTKIMMLAGIVAVLLIVLIATLLGIYKKSSSPRDSPKDDPAPSPAPVPTYDYPCYTSTFDIFDAQVLQTEKEKAELSSNLNQTNTTTIPHYYEPMLFRICPDTTIEIGTFRNPVRGDFNFTNGDFTLIVARPNVTIQCGGDGRRDNNCTIQGGLAHVVTQFAHGHPTRGTVYPSPHLNGMTVRGLTFGGDFEPAGPFGGLSIALSHPALDTTFEDCAWIGSAATKRLVTIGRNFMMELLGIPLAQESIHVTFRNCLFQDVSYEEDFIASYEQYISIESSTFERITLSPLLSAGCGFHPHGCRTILHCYGQSTCGMSNSCVEQFDVAGPGPILISAETTWLNGDHSNTWTGPVQYENFVKDPATPNPGAFAPIPENESPTEGGEWGDDGLPPPQFCALGVARLVDDDMNEDNRQEGDGGSHANAAMYTCLDSPVFILQESGDSSCPYT